MKPPVSVEVGATAKATVSISGEIPQKSLGRLVDTISDVFRPFSEARGLRADQIRLQREEVAIEIAKRARARLAIEQMDARPVDAKILIPLIEKGSLENAADDEMIERWSALLANAATVQKVEPRYVQILSELTARQALLFEKMMLNQADHFRSPDQILDDASAVFDSPRIREELSSVFRGRRTRMEPDQIIERVLDMLHRPGCLIMDVILFEPDDQMYSLDYSSLSEARYDTFELDLEIIASLGLAKRVALFYSTKFREDLQLFYYHATELGIAFFKCVDRRDLRSKSATTLHQSE